MASNSWTQAQITKWATKTFGEVVNVWDLITRADKEFKELVSLHYVGHHDKTDEIAEEIADVVIVLSQAMQFIGRDLEEEIAKKMIINVNREWIKTGEGVGRHA